MILLCARPRRAARRRDRGPAHLRQRDEVHRRTRAVHLFAPSNHAFLALRNELGITRNTLFADKALLTKVLTYRVLPKRVLKTEIPLEEREIQTRSLSARSWPRSIGPMNGPDSARVRGARCHRFSITGGCLNRGPDVYLGFGQTA